MSVKCILVVDDEPSILELIKLLLNSSGYEVITASDGEEALEILNSGIKKVSLVLSDVRMPKMSGPELLKKLRKDDPPIVFMSAHSSANIEELMEHGGNGFLKKPFLMEELMSAIEPFF